MIWRALALVFILAAPAWATVDGWPALYDVIDVSEDDVLNIRGAPSAGADIVGTLAPDARGVEVLGVNRAESWGRVSTAEGVGWVSMAFLARRPGQWTGDPPVAMACAGTEPFWTFEINDAEATFESMGALPLDFSRTVAASSRNRIDAHVRVFENDLGGLVANLRNATCSDGMSDREYGWAVDLLVVVAGTDNAQMFSGCCSLVAE